MEIENPYNNPESVQARKDQEDPLIMYLIVRDSLNMSVGKIAAQVGHAVGMVYGHAKSLEGTMNIIYDDFMDGGPALEEVPKYVDAKNKWLLFDNWQKDSFRKVVLKAKDNKWEKLKDTLDCFVVRDAGLTEIAPGSETVIAVWPMKRSERPNILKKLQTLK